MIRESLVFELSHLTRSRPGRQVDVGVEDTGHRLQAVFDQPDTGRTVDAFHQQVDIPDLPKAVDELLLDVVEIVEGQFFGQLRGWRQGRPFGGAAIETLESGGVYGLAYAFAADTTETALFTIDIGDDFLVRGYRQTAMVTGAICGVWEAARYAADFRFHFFRQRLSAARNCTRPPRPEH